MSELDYLLKSSHPSFVVTYPDLIILESNPLGKEMLNQCQNPSSCTKLTDVIDWHFDQYAHLSGKENYHVRTHLKNGEEIILSYRLLKVREQELLSVIIIKNLISPETLETSHDLDVHIENNALFMNIFNHSPVGILLLDSNQVLYKANRYMFDHLGIHYREIVGERFGNVFSCATVFGRHHLCGTKGSCENCMLRNTISAVLNDYKTVENIEIVHDFEVDGIEKKKWFTLSASPVIFGDATYAMLSLVDITHQIEAEEAIRVLGITDGLTKMNNRKHIIDILEEILSHHERKKVFSVGLLDIDNFKHINDYYGQEVGDAILIMFGESIKQTLRFNDSAGRYGGEEFLLLLPDTPLKDASMVIENIRKNIAIQSTTILKEPLTFSAGLLQIHFDDDQQDYRSVLNQTDYYLHEAKADGKNCTKQGDYE